MVRTLKFNLSRLCAAWHFFCVAVLEEVCACSLEGTLLTTLCCAFQSGALQLPYQAVMQPINMLSMVQL
jgi:hypothetical protein